LGAQIIRSQEEERRRVARDIHDGPAQAMANIVFRAEVCERLIDTDVERAKAELRELRDHIRGTLGEIRKIIFDLRPMTLDDLGLGPTIRGVLDNIRNLHGVFTEMSITGKERRLESYVEIGIFRVVQEALNNAVKHAAASTIVVRIDFAPAEVTIVVEDDGKGFDDLAVEMPADRFGLMGMRERLQLLEGKLTIKSTPGRGSRVLINVPLKGAGADG
jgi:two-component system sensor histidine kinase DegS